MPNPTSAEYTACRSILDRHGITPALLAIADLPGYARGILTDAGMEPTAATEVIRRLAQVEGG